MKPPKFKYLRPETIDDALAVLKQHGNDAYVLAGGQSLMPTLNLRLAEPMVLIDISRLESLRGLKEEGDQIKIGAAVSHAEVAASPLVNKHLPLVTGAMPYVAHRAVRNRGTIGGSLSHADPAAELPACAVAMGATLTLCSASGHRDVPASEFFQGVMSTARQEDELLTHIHFPASAANEVWGFNELSRRHGDFAIVGVAARGLRQNDILSDLRLVVFGCEERPVVSAAAADLAKNREITQDQIKQIAGAVSEEINPMSDLNGTPETKRRQAQALVQRTLSAMMEPSTS